MLRSTVASLRLVAGNTVHLEESDKNLRRVEEGGEEDRMHNGQVRIDMPEGGEGQEQGLREAEIVKISD